MNVLIEIRKINFCLLLDTCRLSGGPESYCNGLGQPVQTSSQGIMTTNGVQRGVLPGGEGDAFFIFQKFFTIFFFSILGYKIFGGEDEQI